MQFQVFCAQLDKHGLTVNLNHNPIPPVPPQVDSNSIYLTGEAAKRCYLLMVGLPSSNKLLKNLAVV
jgi:hypothetical protein